MSSKKTKFCKRCEKRKKVEQFYKNKAQPDGFAYYCKCCTKEYLVQRESKDPEYFKQKRKETYKRNYPRLKAYHKKYYSNPEQREKTNQYHREYRKKHKQKMRLYYREYSRWYYHAHNDVYMKYYKKNKTRISQKRKARRNGEK